MHNVVCTVIIHVPGFLRARAIKDLKHFLPEIERLVSARQRVPLGLQKARPRGGDGHCCLSGASCPPKQPNDPSTQTQPPKSSKTLQGPHFVDTQYLTGTRSITTYVGFQYCSRNQAGEGFQQSCFTSPEPSCRLSSRQVRTQPPFPCPTHRCCSQ